MDYSTALTLYREEKERHRLARSGAYNQLMNEAKEEFKRVEKPKKREGRGGGLPIGILSPNSLERKKKQK